MVKLSEDDRRFIVSAFLRKSVETFLSTERISRAQFVNDLMARPRVEALEVSPRELHRVFMDETGAENKWARRLFTSPTSEGPKIEVLQQVLCRLVNDGWSDEQLFEYFGIDGAGQDVWDGFKENLGVAKTMPVEDAKFMLSSVERDRLDIVEKRKYLETVGAGRYFAECVLDIARRAAEDEKPLMRDKAIAAAVLMNDRIYGKYGELETSTLKRYLANELGDDEKKALNGWCVAKPKSKTKRSAKKKPETRGEEGDKRPVVRKKRRGFISGAELERIKDGKISDVKVLATDYLYEGARPEDVLILVMQDMVCHGLSEEEIEDAVEMAIKNYNAERGMV